MDAQMLTLRAMRMMRFVRLRLSTSELVEARDITSRAVVSRGASWAAAKPGKHKSLLWDNHYDDSKLQEKRMGSWEGAS